MRAKLWPGVVAPPGRYRSRRGGQLPATGSCAFYAVAMLSHVIVVALAGFVIVWGWTRDVIFAALRERVVERESLPWWVKYLLGCGWCLSRWVCPLIALLFVWPSSWAELRYAGLVGVAAAALTGAAVVLWNDLVDPEDED